MLELSRPTWARDHFRRRCHLRHFVDTQRTAIVDGNGALSQDPRHLFDHPWFVRSYTSHDPISDHFSLAPFSWAPTEHRDWFACWLAPDEAELPKRAPASIARSFHSDVAGQSCRDQALGIPEELLRDLAFRIEYRSGEGDVHLRVHVSYLSRWLFKEKRKRDQEDDYRPPTMHVPRRDYQKDWPEEHDVCFHFPVVTATLRRSRIDFISDHERASSHPLQSG